jgi:hypothetical protein
VSAGMWAGACLLGLGCCCFIRCQRMFHCRLSLASG